MIRKILSKDILFNTKPSRSVISAAFVITIAGIVSRLFGLFRDRLLASTFGAGDILDVYYAAFRIPDLIYNLLILGALSAAFIPVFTALVSKEKEEEAWELANGILNTAIFVIVVFSVFFFIFAPYIMNLITPGFPPEKMRAVVLFSRIMFLSPLFLGISGIFGGILTSYRRFIVYSLAPVAYNIGIITGVLLFVRIWGAVGLAWGVVAGAFLHMIIQYPAARHLGFRYKGISLAVWKNIHIKRIGVLMFPRMLGIAVNQINLLVMTMFASMLMSGSLAVFSFAQNLQSVPLGIFGISFSIAVFPVLSGFIAREDKENFVKTFSQTFRQILFFVIPLSVFILVLRAQLVRVVLGSGQFNWEDTILTYQCLGIFTISLFAQSTIPLLARSFYALQDTKTPFYIALITEVINIVAVLFFIGKMQITGLALAFSIASIVQMFLLLFVLRARFEHLDDRTILKSVFKIALASFIAGLTIQATKYAVASMVSLSSFLGVFTQLTVSFAIGISVFIIVSQLLALEEFVNFKNSLTRRLLKGKQVITEDTKEVSGI